MSSCIEDANRIQVSLNRIIGQLAGVKKMIEEGVKCEDVLMQINAAGGALRRIGLVILEGHLRHCVRDGIERGNADEVIENFADALEHFSRMA